MTQDKFGPRAAAALDAVLPRRDRIKTVQRLFDVSGRMARYLLVGDHWTARRMTQASDLLGAAFDAAFSQAESNEQYEYEMKIYEAHQRRAEQEIEQMRRIRLAGVSSIDDVSTSRSVSRIENDSKSPPLRKT